RGGAVDTAHRGGGGGGRRGARARLRWRVTQADMACGPFRPHGEGECMTTNGVEEPGRGSGTAGGGAEAWLEVDATVVERGFEASIRVGPGEVLAVLGPNGAGKATLLSVIAGLVGPAAGLVRAGDRVLLATAAGIDVPVAERRVGLLAQDGLLFGSLSVAENVEFGPRSQGFDRDEAASLAARWLAEVGAEDLAGRKPR